MRSRILNLFLIVLITGAESDRDNVAKWSVGFKFLLKNCPLVPWKDPGQQGFLEALKNCLQRRVLIAVNAFFDEDIIPIFDGIDLVRLIKTFHSFDSDELSSNKISTDQRSSDSNSWADLTDRIFQNRYLKLDLGHLTNLDGNLDGNLDDNAVNRHSKSNDLVEGRRRRRKQGMMMMLMMGLLLMGTVLIPMGFQFLAVLGGKALLLAKMALMLSSIQGLKRVATSGVNYGLHYSPEAWHERSEPSDQVYEVPYQPYPLMSGRH
ncbi:uncharacterized protein LOC122504485 [Leptopilina heterotoma]|uniref:uncharacterized protein LOC122504485 n=1 Tax=Leptopilina heterotoma TaxID=63436 RepID=UPI001CA7D47D|nr:uncharacterized protein LOC122504485 [Leptopilina heterotoma]